MAVNGRLEFIDKEMCVLKHLGKHRHLLMCSSKRIEKQIKDIQDKAETVKMEVCYARALEGIVRFTDHGIDHTNPIGCATVTTTSGSSISATFYDIQIRYPSYA
jgi:hypothetical protein